MADTVIPFQLVNLLPGYILYLIAGIHQKSIPLLILLNEKLEMSILKEIVLKNLFFFSKTD
jgi:hypothetical protein